MRKRLIDEFVDLRGGARIRGIGIDQRGAQRPRGRPKSAAGLPQLGLRKLDGFIRQWWFDRKTVRYSNVEDVTFDGIRSERTDVLALRLLWGTASEPKFKAGRNSANVLEFFGGVGYRWKSGSWVMHTGTYQGNPVYEYAGGEDSEMPTLHFGVRLFRVVRAAVEAP